MVRSSLSLGVFLLSCTVAAGQGFSPEEAVKRMKVPDDLEVRLVAADPRIRQTVTITFDDRGRMWVIQYLQYPNPAGLKPVEVDQWLRTKYDKVPLPPPRGPKGADRITILDDPDETGRYRKSKDFITGLNLASGMCLGHGGVYVAQPPYLLFYPDKNGAKHGELKSPHAYGYFGHVPYTGFKGGHVTCGGIVYHGGTLPAKYHGQYLAANLLSNALYWHTLEPKGSSFVSRFGGDLLIGNDTWFRPVDCLVGPDGALYVADWYDKRANHVDPIDNWDRSNGRIYKLQARGAKPQAPVNLAKLSSVELLNLLDHPNNWYSREARRLLAA